MKYDVISADCHIDLIWLPPDLFTANAPAALKDRMPYVAEGERGKEWVTKSGASFGLMNGMGSAGRLYEPGKIHRSDRMAAQGLYDDGKKGIRRLTDPDLRIKDQDRDGIQAEVLYGILGATSRINDDEAAGEMLRIYNEWLARLLQQPSRPLCRARLHPQPRHRRRRRRDRAGGAARRRARSRNLAPGRHDAAVGPVVGADVERGRGQRPSGAFPYDRQRGAPRLDAIPAEGGTRRARLGHHQLPDVYVGRADVGDLRRRARAPSRHPASSSARPAPAGSHTSCSAWTPSGRTSSRSST